MGFQDDAIEVKDVREAVLRLKWELTHSDVSFKKLHDTGDTPTNIIIDEIFGEKLT